MDAKTISLPDGRKLAYDESGDPSGKPVFFFHGWCSSRLLRHPDDAQTAALGARLITVDRPGAGASDFRPNRTLLDWADDVAALADALKADTFSIVAHSGAGPHALACAHKLKERVRHVAVASGFAPVERPGALEGMSKQMRDAVPGLKKFPFIASLLLWPMPRRYRKDPERAFHTQFGTGLPEADRAALARPDVGQIVYTAAAEAFRQGSRGAALEILLFLARPWGFEPEQLEQPVSLWYGTADTLVPVGMGRLLAKAIKRAELTELPGAGHMAFLEHWQRIVRTAVSA
jgi:pimeloyl-ACP methyl ester carboxylesterase